MKLNRTTAQPFKFVGKTNSGTVSVAIPRNFAGPIRSKSSWGKRIFSKSLQSNVAMFSQDIAFVGDWQTTGFKDFKLWNGDEIEVETHCGDISFMYADEADESFDHSSENTFEKAIHGILDWFGVQQR